MEESNSSVQVVIPPKESFAKEWSSDQKAFKGVPWGKAMMWIFLVSDTFVFSIFLISYMTVRFSTKNEWPNPSEVFGLHVGQANVPLLLIAIMTFILITSSGTMALAVKYCYEKNYSYLKEFDFEFLMHNYFPIPKNSFVLNIASLDNYIWFCFFRQIKL